MAPVPGKPISTPAAAPAPAVTALPTMAEAEAAASRPATSPQDGAATAPVKFTAEGVTRPLPPETVNLYQPQKGHLIFGQTSDQGMVRTNNQDAALSFFSISHSEDERPDFGLFIVADGMGGHELGEKASALTSRIVADTVLQKIYLPMLDSMDNSDADRPTVAESLNSAVKLANERVIKQIPQGGTTLTAVVVMGNMAHVAHVGDSRAYLVNRSEVEQITRDHSLVQRLIELGQITPDEAQEHPQRNVLYRAIGQTPDLEVDTLTRRLVAGINVLVCSDGLWGWVSEKEIVDIVNNTGDPQEACDKLVALANTHGGHDNITAVLFKMPGQQG
ncbi:MAG: protein phosphatase 2C domain-containing protein [Anaerolineae bacterium]|nr:protein phosphatase 2C domain-containing protein [Anaerolineae bacterium]